MKYNSDYAELNTIQNEINAFTRQWPNISKIISGRLQEFGKHNGTYLSLLNERGAKLMEDNVMKDDKGEWEVNKDEAGKRTGWKFYSEDHEKKFNEGLKELLQRPCTIII